MDEQKAMLMQLYNLCKRGYEKAMANADLVGEEYIENQKRQIEIVEEMLNNHIEIKP